MKNKTIKISLAVSLAAAAFAFQAEAADKNGFDLNKAGILESLQAFEGGLLLAPVAAPAIPDTGADPRYYTIGKVATTVSVTEGDDGAQPEPMPLQEDVKMAGAIVNTGVTAWNVVNSGQASSSMNHYYASAVPSMMFDWASYTGWKGPKKALYELKAENLYGITVLDLVYEVSFYYGGHAQDKKGVYITNFTVKPVKFDTKWGFKFTMDMKISDPMNVATPEDPLAYLQADMNWTLSSPLKHERGFQTYAVYGNGDFKDISPEVKASARGKK
jgi:hypothetical protein